MATRPETAAAVKEIVARIEALQTEKLFVSDLEVVRAACGFKHQEIGYGKIKENIDDPPQTRPEPNPLP